MKQVIEVIILDAQLAEQMETNYREALIEDMVRRKILRMRAKPSRKAKGQLDAAVALFSAQLSRIPTVELRDFLSIAG